MHPRCARYLDKSFLQWCSVSATMISVIHLALSPNYSNSWLSPRLQIQHLGSCSIAADFSSLFDDASIV